MPHLLFFSFFFFFILGSLSCAKSILDIPSYAIPEAVPSKSGEICIPTSSMLAAACRWVPSIKDACCGLL